MLDKSFIDSNILIYLYSEDEIEKNQKSKELFLGKLSIISLQVLNEISNTFLKKFKLSPDEVANVIHELSKAFTIVKPNEQTILSALNILKKYNYSYYDSLIIATSLEFECTTLYSEDMQHNQIIENNLKIINPFLN